MTTVIIKELLYLQGKWLYLVTTLYPWRNKQLLPPCRYVYFDDSWLCTTEDVNYRIKFL